MAVVINGSGTVTGISVGGLPDGIVDSGTLATNSVDSAELIDGAVDNSHIDAMAASKLTGALPAISGASLTGLEGVPSGVIIVRPVDDIPTGYLECDGAAISRTTYSDLFGVLSTVYGVGDGSSTFNIPDLRGEFIRGWDNGRGEDSGRAIGNQQGADIAAHNHSINIYRSTGSTNLQNYIGARTGGETEGTGNTNASTGSETRPRNVAMMFCIKY